MKKSTLTLVLIFCISLFVGEISFAQNYVPFSVKYNQSLKGDILQIGNGIVNRNAPPLTPNDAFNGAGNNNDFNMQYIDVDGDPSTFSSSTANLVIPVATPGCYRVAYAALYWGGLYSQANINDNSVNRTNLNKVKFKTPGGTYTDLTGTLIYDAYPTILSLNQTGYAAFADVTTLIQGLPDANGTYAVANLIAGNSNGGSGGWTLFIVYEDPLTTAKNITAFDGFSAVRSTQTLNIPISGFTTIPVGPVRSKVAFATMEGDLGLTGDSFRVNGVDMSLPTRLNTNYFNSTINDINGAFNARVPNSNNLLGFDAGVFNVPNPGNTLINNGATNATLTLVTSGDAYFYYFNAFAIEIIQPQINLIKTVSNLSNVNIGGGNVNLGQELYYDLSFQNIGNDNATNFTITDILPTNVNFLPADLILPPGVTYTFNAVTNTIVFTIPNALVTQGGALYQIRIKVRVVDDCSSLRDACSNEVKNLAFKTYYSQNSGILVENQQPSASGISTCLIPEPGTTNFLVGINGCNFVRDEILCGSSVVLTAGSGYTGYQWHSGSPPTAANLIPGATSQTYTATAIGTYSVVNTAPATCLSIVETVNVVDFNGAVPNPVIPYADEVVICPNDGSELPKIFLCGVSDSQLIQTNILNATSIIWEKLVDASCPPVAVANCPNTNSSCTWTQVGTGPNFNVTTAGQYRVRIVFQNGCFKNYYFNVFQNLFTPTEVHSDIICTTNGSITINGVPAGYQYSITGPSGPWQNSNTFSVNTPGNYTAYIQQIGGGVGNCLFTIPNIPIIVRNFTVNVIPTQPLCNGSLGSIRVQVNNVNPQYTYQLFLGATLVSSAGPINTNDYTFSNLNAGTYTVVTTTSNGCTNSQTVTLVNPAPITVSAAITIPLTCTPGEITIYPVGGTPPYIYQVSTIPGFQAVPQFQITTAGTYNITVTDINNCSATTSIVVNQIPPPVFTITQSNVNCNGSNTGNITFNVSNTNGYTLQFSIDNGVTFSSNPVFNNLAAGTYQTLVQYSLGASICTTVAQPIIISQPPTALSAVGAVTELAGCGPNGEASVVISNPTGGIPPYSYSFNNGVTYGASNQAYLMPGTYTLYVRDANGCVFPMVITIAPEAAAPTISLTGPVYNCNGTGNITVNTNNNGGNFSYLFYLDGVLNTPSTSGVFTNIPCGPHNISIEYLDLTPPPTFNNLLLEDFGQGANTTSPGIDVMYCFENQVPPSTCGNGIQINESDYVVTKRINPIPNVWNDVLDHTSNGTNVNGRFLCVNIGGPASLGKVLYRRTLNNIIPNVQVEVSLWAMTMLQLGNTGQEPNLTLELIKDFGLPGQSIVSSVSTGDIPKTINVWRNYLLNLNPGNNSTLTFVIKSYIAIPVNEGVGVAIDDINLHQLPRVCSNTVTYPVIIDCSNAFSAQITSVTNVSCNGLSNGQITIGAQNFGLPYGFDYSINGGTTWINSTSSPVTITGLAVGTYNIIIRYNNTPGTCSFSFTQSISQPSVLIANATITGQVTCLTNGQITATSTGIGGTPNYQYQLQNGVGGILVPFQSNPVFSNLVAGTYVVVVRDALGCIDAIDVPLILVPPTNPTATISVASDLCYDGVNAATIVVSASGGVPPYQYSLNGGVFQGSNTFAGLTPGNYTIIVKDSYGCTFTLPVVPIRPQLTATMTLTSNLNCTASPNAIITGNVLGGTTPYSYQVSFNGGALSASTTIVGSSFTYSTPTPGNYQFTITDAIGCRFVTAVITVNPLPILNPPVVVITNPIRCFGDANAAISVTNSGGLPPYTINVFNSTTGVNYGTQTSGLTAGNYVITTTDSNSCTASTNIVINQPAAVNFTSTSTNILCGASGTIPGVINVTGVTGGTLPYTYTVTNSTGTFTLTYNAAAGEDHSFSILNFGIYTINVVDANGCQLIRTNTISSPPSSLNITPSIVGVDCTTGGTIQVCVNTAVAGGPYFFSIYQDLSPALPGYPTYPGPSYQPADASDPTGLCSTFTSLTPGVTYSFIVYDQATNCYYFETASGPIPTLSTMTVTAPVVTNVTCTGSADGNVSFTFSGYSGTSVSYQIFTSLNNVAASPLGTASPLAGGPITINNFGTLAPGQYYILLTENNGIHAACSITSINFTISESPVLLSLVANVIKNDNCTLNAGQILVIGSNGTPAYTYQIVPTGGPAPTVATWAGQSSNVFNVEGGTYDIYIKDLFNCIRFVTNVFVPTDTNPSISLSLVASTLCNSAEGSYSIRVTRNNAVGIAPFTYSIDGGSFNSYTEDASFSFIISGLNSGTHTVVIKDANGCTDTKSIVILPPLNGNATVTLAAIQNCGASDGIITINAAGGSGGYSYSILPNPAVISLSSNVFSNVPAGNYVVTVTDVTTLCTTTIPVTIAAPSAVTFTSNVTNTSCFSGADGSISIVLNPSNTDPVYTYQITAPIVVGPQSSNVFNGLAANTYTVLVTSSRGCTATQNIIVGQPAAINVPATVVSQFNCNAGTNATNFATITVNGVTGGSSTYINYEFILGGITVQSGASNVYTSSNLLGGTYTINVYDNNGCVGTNTAIINPFVGLTSASVTVTNPITCTSNEDITINVISTGGALPVLNYTVTGLGGNTYNVTQTSPNFTGLTVGNYSITVVNPVTGCSIQTVHFVFDPNTFDVIVTNNNNVTCFGGNDGSVALTFIDLDVTPVDEAGPFNYAIYNSANTLITSGSVPNAGPFNVTGLSSGVYSVQATLTNTPFCTVTKFFTITQPTAALTISATSTLISCIATSNDGTISASALNGWGSPYEFQLELGASVISAWSSNSTFTGLTAGNYTVSVRDAAGCIVSTNVILSIPTPINASANASTTNLLCFGDTTASITVSGVTGGFGSGYLYNLVNVNTGAVSGPQSSNVFNNLGAGTYNVIVTDPLACSFTTANITISQPANIVTAQLNLTTSATCLTNATITLSASGGTAPYRYSATSGGPYIAFVGSVSFNVTSGTYQYYVVDANNCTQVVSNSLVVQPVIPVSVAVNLANATILCNGGTATVSAVATNGLGGYTYTLQPLTAGVIQTSPGVFSNVPAGNYTILVNSGNCVGVSAPFTVTQPTLITYTSTFTNVTCNGLNNGTINVVATGGTGTIQYSISSNPLQTVNNGLFTGLAPGNYIVSVQDQAGCFLAPLSFTITEPTPITLATFVPTQELCFNDGGAIGFSLTGGTTTATVGYTVSVNGGAFTQTSLTGVFNFTNLPAGTYDFIITDANGCSDFQFTQILNPGVDIQAIPDVTYLCTSNNVPSNEVLIDVNPNVPLSELTFSLDGAAPVSSNIFNGVSPGNHVIAINHISGCIEVVNFTVGAFTSPVLTLTESGLNQFTATTTGGAGGNEYILNGVNVGTTTVYSINQTGNYTVTVIDDNGCEDTKTIFMTFYDVLIPDYFTPDGDGNNDGWSPIYTDNFPNMVVYIFDRYSRKIITLGIGESWDGTYKNNPLPTGDYWYVIKLNGVQDTREFMGNFTLYR